MTWLKILLSRFRALFHKQELESGLEEEVRFHLQMEEEENIRRGMNPEQARYAALRNFGGVDQAKESWRDLRWLRVEPWWNDLRVSARCLARSPGFATFAVLSLALGIGANTAIFTLVQSLVLQPLPYPEPARLVRLWETAVLQGQQGIGAVSLPNLADWRRDCTVCEHLGGFNLEGVNLTHGGGAHRLVAGVVESDVFPAVGVAPLLGRTFSPEEDEPGHSRVAVLSHHLWHSDFGADPALVGRAIRINGAEHTVVGVMPQGYQFPPRSSAALWVPLSPSPRMRADRASHWVQVIARLKPGVSWLAAQENLNQIAGRLRQQFPDVNSTRGVIVEPLHLATVRAVAQLLLVLAGAVGFVLLLSCANVAHLVLARAAGRRRELGVRLALGAGRWHIVRLLSLESVLLSAMGGALGLLGSYWCLDLLLAFAGSQLPPGVVVQPDRSSIWFCILASIVAAVLAGLVPALRSSRIDVQASIKDAGSSSGSCLRRNHSALMTCEVALALVLAIGALLLMRSLQTLHRFDLGFQPEQLLTMKLSLPEMRYTQREPAVAFYHRLLDQVRALPGVNSAGAINLLPVEFCCANLGFEVAGRPAADPGHEPTAEHRLVTPGYFETMQIPLLVGRYLTDEDRASGRRVVLLSRSTAARYFPDANPVGQRIRYLTKIWEAGWLTVVGVVGDVRSSGVYRPAPTIIYVPYGQSEWPWTSTNLVLRTPLDPAPLTAAVRRLVRDLDADAVVSLEKTMSSVVSDSVARTRLLAQLLMMFCALALLLAVVGVYGVMSHLVTQRTHEIGVRMALGSSRLQVVRLVLLRGLRNALAGSALGLVCTFMMGFALRHFLIGIRVVDAWAYASALAGVLVISLTASTVPAWRAARLDPLSTLRNE